MFKKESDKKSFTARDIDRYHNGQMTPAERNALERAALDDPFLEEAMEGYALRVGTDRHTEARADGPTAEQDLEDVRSRLDQRVNHGRNRFLLPAWSKVAAIVLLLAGAGSLLYRGWNKNAPQIAVVKTPAPPKEESPSKELPAPKVQTEQKKSANPEHITPATDSSFSLPVASDLAKSEARNGSSPLSDQKKSGVLQEVRANDSVRLRLAQTDTGGVARLPLSPVPGAIPMSRSFKKSGPTFQYNNRVIDANHQPIPYASVTVTPSGAAVTTDANGYFSIKVSDSTEKVSVSAVGFDNKQYSAYQLSDSAALTLKERSNTLNDVVVIGYGSKKKERYIAHPYHAENDSLSVFPIEGWGSYHVYLAQNIQLPDEVLRNQVHGDVTLSFELDEVGNPVNIIVKKSLCVPCDAEAIRLVKSGPQWKKAKHKRKAKGVLQVHF